MLHACIVSLCISAHAVTQLRDVILLPLAADIPKLVQKIAGHVSQKLKAKVDDGPQPISKIKHPKSPGAPMETALQAQSRPESPLGSPLAGRLERRTFMRAPDSPCGSLGKSPIQLHTTLEEGGKFEDEALATDFAPFLQPFHSNITGGLYARHGVLEHVFYVRARTHNYSLARGKASFDLRLHSHMHTYGCDHKLTLAPNPAYLPQPHRPYIQEDWCIGRGMRT